MLRNSTSQALEREKGKGRDVSHCLVVSTVRQLYPEKVA